MVSKISFTVTGVVKTAVSADPALSAQVLKLANSSFYPTNAKVD